MGRDQRAARVEVTGRGIGGRAFSEADCRLHGRTAIGGLRGLAASTR
jgi:hypothetical protein